MSKTQATILIIDDDEDVLLSAKLLLKNITQLSLLNPAQKRLTNSYLQKISM